MPQQLSREDFKKLAFGEPDEELSPEAFKAAAFGGPEEPSQPQPEATGLGAHLSSAYQKLAGPLVGSALEGLSAIPGEARIAADKLGLTALARKLPPAASIAPGPLSMPLHFAQNPELMAGAEAGLKGAAQAVYPEEQRGKGSLWSEGIPGAIGSVIGGAPAMALGGPAASLIYGAQNGVPLYYEIKANGGSEADAIKGLLFGNATGLLEKFGAEKYASSVISKLSKGKFGEALKRAAIGWAMGAPAEVGTEALQQGLQDLALEELSDADVDNWGRIKATMGPAFFMGGFASGLDAVLQQRGQAQAKPGEVRPTPAEPAQKARTVANIGPETAPAPAVPTPATQKAKAPWEQTREEFEAQNPQSITKGSTAQTRGEAFDKLPDDADVWVYHATDDATADKMLAEGVRQADKPRTLASEQYAAGKGASFQPGAGLGRGTYVGAEPVSVDGYGRRILAFKVKKGDIRIPPEGQMLGKKSPGLALSDSDAFIETDLPASSVVDVTEKGRSGRRGHEAFVRRAISEGKNVPKAVAESYGLAPAQQEEQGQVEIPGPPAPGGEQTAEGAKPDTTQAAPSAVEGTVPEPESTGVANKAVERELEKMGLEMPEKAQRKGFVELHAKAKAKLETDADAGRKLVDDLENDPRAPSDEESALLTFEANRLIQERNKAETEYTETPSAQNKARVEQARDEYFRAAGVFDMAGTQSGRALNARKMMLKNDYSLTAMERKIQVAQKGEDLSEEQSKKIKELSEKIAASEKAIQEAKSQADLKEAEHAAEVAMLKLQKEAKGLQRRSKRKAEIEQTKKELGEILEELGKHTRGKAAAGLGGLDAKTLALTAKAAAKTIKLGGQTFVQWADSMVARFGEGIRPYLQQAWETGGEENRLSVGEALKGQQSATETQRTVEKIALSFVEGGVTDRTELTKKVHSVVSHFRPDMTLEQTRDAISGYGIFKKLSKNQARQKLNDLKGELRELGKIEDLLAGHPPKKTGFERRQKTQTELKLSDKAATLAKKLGLTPTRKKSIRLKVGTATEEQVALKQTQAKIKAYKTKLQNQIEDLQRRMREKDFSKPVKRPVQLDEAAIKQVAEREKLKGEFAKMEREAEMATWGPGRKALHGLAEMSKASRALRFGFDLPPIFRQASKIAVPDIFLNPKRLVTLTGRGIRAMSEAKAVEYDAKMRQGAKYELAQAAKLSLPPVEEEMESWVASKLAPVRASGRVYNTFMNQYRMSLFSAMLDGLPTTPTLDDAKLIASGVNILTGRGNATGKAAAFMEAAGAILTAPRLYLSQFQSMFAVPALKAQVAGNKAVRNQFVKQYAKTIAGYAALYALVQTIDELDGEDDVRIGTSGSDKGKIIVGNKRYDPLGGFSQALNLVARGLSDAYGTISGTRKEPGYKEDTFGDMLKDFIRMRLAPSLSVVADVVEGTQVDRDASGKPLPTTVGSSLKKLFVPLSVEEIIEETQKLGVKKADAEQILTAIQDRVLGLLGMSVKDYGPPKRKSLLKARRGS